MPAMFKDASAISTDARFVVFPIGLMNRNGGLVANDIFRSDQHAGSTGMVWPPSDGRGACPGAITRWRIRRNRRRSVLMGIIWRT